MRRYLSIWLLCLFALPIFAQTNEPTSAAGYDFYFTLFDHWGWSGNSDAQTIKYCGFTVCAVEDGDLTLSAPTSTGDKFIHFGAYTNMAASLRNVYDAVLKGVHFHSTGGCFLHVWAHGQNAGDETMILPKHLLGTKYMVQGVPGALYYVEPNNIPTYSQFTVVGTENGTNVVVTPKEQLRCVNRNNAVIPAGRSSGLFIQENEVLLFQPDDYTKDVSGTLIESDKVVAVFQGNTFTNIQSVYGGDFVWEQARPTDSWGKEFIVAKSTRTPNALCRLTALYDNTEVYYYMAGNKYLLKNLSAGESVEGTSILPVEHFEANQPVCCYLYTKSGETNDDIGDPSMTEIIPVDNMATETRWMLEQVQDNAPYAFSLLVTTRLEDEAKVKYNNIPLSSFQTDGNSVYRTVTDGFVTYEIGISAYMASKLVAEDGAGFSAYILRIGNIAEASAFNISLPYKTPPPDLCTDGVLLFKEDFGGNSPDDPVVGTAPVPGMSSQYTQIYDTATCRGGMPDCVGMGSGRYLVTKRGFRNSVYSNYSVWHIMDDHTSFGDTTTGYFLEIDGRETGQDVFYSTTMDGLCPGLELSFSAYVANVTTAGQYNGWREGRGYVHPKLTFVITNPRTGREVARYNTDTIAHDWSLFGTPSAWKYTANWQQVGMNFVVPEGVSQLKLSIRNNASGSTGNDFALDDIEVRLCMPPVSITGEDSVCAGDTVQLKAELDYPYMIYEPLIYRWEFSSDSVTWTTVQNSLSDRLIFNRLKETNAGWYRVSMGTDGNIDSENCRSTSAPFRLTVNNCEPLCTDGQLLFREDFGGDEPDQVKYAENSVFYDKTFEHVCGGTKLTFMTDIVDVETSDTYRYPDLLFQLYSGDAVITQYATWQPHMDTIAGIWSREGFTYTMPETVESLRLLISNNSSGTPGQLGNNFSIDNIEVRLCMPPVSITAPDTVCWGDTARLEAELDYPYMIYEPLFYLWEFSSDSINWTPIQNAMSETLTLTRFQETDAGWYRVSMGTEDNISSANCRSTSEPVRIEVKLCVPPVTIQAPDTVCIDTKNIFIADFENQGVMNEPLQYFWEFSSDSVTWTPAQDGDEQELKLKAKPRHNGWYRVTVYGDGSTPDAYCHVTSEPFRFYVIEDCPPILCPEGILLFREDFGGNDPNDPRISTTPVTGMTYNQLTDDSFGSMRSGSYLITKSGYCNGDTTINNTPQNRRSQWHLQDDHTYPNDNTRGYFLEIDGKGDNAAFYTTTIDGLCVGSDLSFMSYVANVMTWGQYVGSPGRYAYPRLLFRLTNPSNGAELGLYDTGEIPFDSTFINDYSCWKYSSKWHQVGMNFTVPEGISSVTLTIYNNAVGHIGNDFAIDDIEIRLCLEPITVEADTPSCRKASLTFQAKYDNYGILESPEYRWEYSSDSAAWTVLQTSPNKTYSIDTIHRSDEGWYRVSVANTGNLDMSNCRSESEPFHLSTIYCNTATDRFIDTVACDTLMPIEWRGHTWSEVGTVIDTLRDIDIDDSLYIHLSIDTVTCCPEIIRIYADSAICDTLLPFLWFYQDTMLLFSDIGLQEIEYGHRKWLKCTGEIHTLSLDTFHCERLYPIIVNKYNWQLLCDNITLRRLFPEQKAVAFQWYKDEQKILGANEDDYSEQNELRGVFQLRVQMDDGLYVWSNILEINNSDVQQPVHLRIYDSHGFLMPEGNLPRGVYLFRYEQGDRVWTEKKLIL